LGEVWVELDMEMRAVAALGSTVKWFCMIREERKGYPILPAAVPFVSWQNRIHSDAYNFKC